MKKISRKAEEELQELVRDLNQHCYLYYVLDSPIISDEDYAGA
jgi:DNA ligase (NAD+)